MRPQDIKRRTLNRPVCIGRIGGETVAAFSCLAQSTRGFLLCLPRKTRFLLALLSLPQLAFRAFPGLPLFTLRTFARLPLLPFGSLAQLARSSFLVFLLLQGGGLAGLLPDVDHIARNDLQRLASA